MVGIETVLGAFRARRIESIDDRLESARFRIEKAIETVNAQLGTNDDGSPGSTVEMGNRTKVIIHLRHDGAARLNPSERANFIARKLIAQLGDSHHSRPNQQPDVRAIRAYRECQLDVLKYTYEISYP